MAKKDVFILGAGFSKAIDCRMPTTAELTNIVSGRLEKLNILLPPPLQDTQYIEKQMNNNIEFWMTYLSEKQPWLSDADNRKNCYVTCQQIQELMVDVLNEQEAQIMESPCNQGWLFSLIEYWSTPSSKDDKVTVITLNYDTLVERAAKAMGVALRQIYPPGLSDLETQSATLGRNDSDRRFTLYKLHGSVNWSFSEGESTSTSQVYYYDIPSWGENGPPQPVHPMRAAIIPPIFNKERHLENPTIREIWRAASDALWEATRVFIIGYSLPTSDLAMRFFLKRNQPYVCHPWYIVNPDKKTAKHYQELLAPLEVIYDDFIDAISPVRKFVDAYPSLPLTYSAPQLPHTLG